VTRAPDRVIGVLTAGAQSIVGNVRSGRLGGRRRAGHGFGQPPGNGSTTLTDGGFTTVFCKALGVSPTDDRREPRL